MDTPDLYHRLSESLRIGDVDGILEWLPYLENEALECAIKGLIATDRDMLHVTKVILRIVDLDFLLGYFCKRLGTIRSETFVSYSSKGYSQFITEHPFIGVMSMEEIQSRFYTAFNHLCTYVLERKPTFLLVGLSSTVCRVTLTIHTDIPFVNLDNCQDPAISMTLSHMYSINGQLNGSNIGLNLCMFRIAMTVGISGHNGISA